MSSSSTAVSRWSVTIGWAAVGSLLVVLLWRAWQGPDVFYHLALGRDVLAEGAFQPVDHTLLTQPSYVNLYWLFQVVCYGLWTAAGVTGVSVLFLLLWTAIFILWVTTAELPRHPVVGLPLALAVVLVLQHRFDPRPEVVSYLLLMVLVGWLARRPPERAAAAGGLALFAVIEALWVNVHGFFVLGPVVVAARLTAAVADREGAAAVRRLSLLLVVTLAASLASPFGLGAWRFVLVLASFLRDMRAEIAEFGPPTGVFLSLWTVRLFWALWTLTVLACIRLAMRRRMSMFAPLIAILGLGLSAASIRNLPLLPIFAAPLWRDALAELSPTSERRPTRLATVLGRTVMVATAAAAVSLAAWFVEGGLSDSLRSDVRFGVGLPPHAFPIATTPYLEAHGAFGRIFNSAADGGYLELQFPDVEVCMDSRYVDAQAVRRYFAALVRPATFRKLDDELGFDAVLLKVVDSGPLALELMRDPEWELVHGDLHRALWTSRDGPLARRWPVEGICLDRADDLSCRVNGLAAIQWTAMLVQAGDHDLLIDGHDQLARSPHIPSFVVQYALQYGLANDDWEVIDRARAMTPRITALDSTHRTTVERLLAAAEARDRR